MRIFAGSSLIIVPNHCFITFDKIVPSIIPFNETDVRQTYDRRWRSYQSIDTSGNILIEKQRIDKALSLSRSSVLMVFMRVNFNGTGCYREQQSCKFSSPVAVRVPLFLTTPISLCLHRSTQTWKIQRVECIITD